MRRLSMMKPLTLIRILAHIKLQQVVDRVVLRDADLVQAHILADELLELVGRNLAQTLNRVISAFAPHRPRPSSAPPRNSSRVVSFLLRTRNSGVCSTNRCPWRITSGKNCRKKVIIKQADVHAVDIGIGGDDDLVVAQVIHVLLDVQRRLKEVELLVLVDHLLRQSVAVQRLAAQREDRLRTRRGSW